eukprot:12933430-Ditylum_brightwellii.AAC.1
MENVDITSGNDQSGNEHDERILKGELPDNEVYDTDNFTRDIMASNDIEIVPNNSAVESLTSEEEEQLKTKDDDCKINEIENAPSGNETS